MSAVDWNLHQTVRELALEVARIAYEGLGSTEFERLRAAFDQKVEQGSEDREVQLRAVTRLLIKKTRQDLQPRSTSDVQIGGLCLMWLSHTRVAEWSLSQLYQWGESL